MVLTLYRRKAGSAAYAPTPRVAPTTQRFYGQRESFGLITPSTGGYGANTLWAMPFYVLDTIPIDQLAINVTTFAAGHARIGIYSALANWLPDALLAAGTDEIDTGTSNGARTTAISYTLLPGQRYCFGLASEANFSGTVHTAVCSPYGASGATDTTPRGCVNRAFTYAALPNPWGGTPVYVAAVPFVIARAV